MKACSKCKEILEDNCFYKKKSKLGLTSACKKCLYIAGAETAKIYEKTHRKERLLLIYQWRNRNRDAYMSSIRKYGQKAMLELRDNKVATMLSAKLSISYKEALAQKELIELQRQIILIKRYEKENRNQQCNQPN